MSDGFSQSSNALVQMIAYSDGSCRKFGFLGLFFEKLNSFKHVGRITALAKLPLKKEAFCI